MASEIYDQLVTVYTCTDNKIRNETEQLLVTSLIDNIQIFQQIAQIAMQKDKMQEQAASLLNSVVLKMLQKGIQLSIHHANSMLAILMSQFTPLKCKQSLIKSMSHIVRKDRSVKTEIETKLKEFLRQDQHWQHQVGIIFFKILSDSLELSTYSQVVQNGYEWVGDFFNLTTYIIAKLQEQPKELLSIQPKNTIQGFEIILIFFIFKTTFNYANTNLLNLENSYISIISIQMAIVTNMKINQVDNIFVLKK